MSEDESLRPSKQQQKREAEAVQMLGRELVELPVSLFNLLLEKLELPERLLEALLSYRQIKAREARRRQLQFIGKLMRGIDCEPIQQALLQVKARGQLANTHLHHLEDWRERLLREGETALQELVAQHPGLELKRLRQLIQAAQRETEKQQPPRAARQLFRYLREHLPG